jgi:hypothetical protein
VAPSRARAGGAPGPELALLVAHSLESLLTMHADNLMVVRPPAIR